MAGPGNILIKVGADAGQAVRELSTLNSSLGDTMTTSEKMRAGLQRAALPAAAALAGIGYAAEGAAKAAAQHAAEQEHLAGMLERTTGATSSQIAATDDWIASLSRATGVSEESLSPALAKLATATGNVNEAQTLLKASMDISAASGKDLATVSTAVAKAHEGSTLALSRLVPGLSEAARKSKDFTVIMDELSQKTGGAMAESASTASGQYQIFTNQIEQLRVELGSALLPVLEAILPIFNQLVAVAAQHTTAIEVLVGAVAALAAGILIANAALKAYEAITLLVKVATAAWTAAQWLLNAALDANPIGIVVVAIAALVAGIVLAYTHSKTFRDIVGAAMDAVKDSVVQLEHAFEAVYNAASSAFNWIVAHWQIALFALGPIGAAIYLLVTNFGKLEDAATAVQSVVVGAFNAIEGAINAVLGAIGSLIDAISKIPSSIHLPSVPNPFALPAPALAGFSSSPLPAGRSSSSSGGITVNVYGAIDPEGTARTIRRILSESQRRLGR